MNAVATVALLVCGAPLTARAPEVIIDLQGAGWSTMVIGTKAAAAWTDADAINGLTGQPPRSEFWDPSHPRVADPDAVVVCPATFNTVNKVAAGHADSYALAVLCEAIGVGRPVLIVPMVNDGLWGHPAWACSLRALSGAGVTFLDVGSGDAYAKPVVSGTGADVVAAFQPRWVSSALARMTRS